MVGAWWTLLAIGCGGDPAPVPPGAPRSNTPAPPRRGTTTPPRTGTRGAPLPTPPDTEKERARIEAENRADDAEAHRILGRFAEMLLDPSKDAGVRGASGTIRVVVDGREGRYRVSFDASKKDADQFVLETEHEEPGLHAGAAAQAKRLAIFALRGPASYVISYSPPVQWHVQTASDGRRIVVMPPHQSAIGASYRLDDEGLVALSGTTDGKTSTRTKFHWRWRGEGAARSVLLDRAVEDDGKATFEFEYADDPVLPLLKRAVLVEGVNRCEVVLAFDRIDRAP